MIEEASKAVAVGERYAIDVCGTALHGFFGYGTIGVAYIFLTSIFPSYHLLPVLLS